MTGPGTASAEGTASRVVVVTGAGRGLGLLTVRSLLDQGDRVIAHYRSRSQDLEDLAEKHPEELHLVAGDICEPQTAEAIVACARSVGRLDAVVHNAGTAMDGPLVTMPVEDWDHVLRTNLRGAFLLTKAALRPMMRQKHGRFVYVSSLVAEVGNEGQASYAASKSALHGFACSVAQEYARFGVRTVALAPGMLDVGLTAAMQPKMFDKKVANSLAGLLDAAAVARTIAFLTTPDSEAINATTVHAHGGIRY
jgi:3-oxoacyl-[acyl-carrier protein] reductase